MDDPPFADRVIEEFVKPLYRFNLSHPIDPAQAELIAQSAQRAASEEIVWMLGSQWRARRVGAWFALARVEPEVSGALKTSLTTSLGNLTAPDVAFAAARRLGNAALPALHEYQAIAAARNFGGLSTITAIIESVGGRSQWAQATDADLAALSHRETWAHYLESGAT
ncbi:hypothetical protein [Schumannella luteola]